MAKYRVLKEMPGLPKGTDIANCIQLAYGQSNNYFTQHHFGIDDLVKGGWVEEVSDPKSLAQEIVDVLMAGDLPYVHSEEIVRLVLTSFDEAVKKVNPNWKDNYYIEQIRSFLAEGV